MRQVLRDYQVEGRARIFEAWRSGARAILCVSPTGSGKTTTFVDVIAALAVAQKRSLILVHRRELATQAAARLREFGVDFGYEMFGEPRKPYAPVQIASVQTLVRRQCPPAALVVADEAHLSTARTWHTIISQYPNAKILGVTATPWRLSGKPLAGAYDACVVISTPRELREQGYLCPYTGFSYLTPDLSGVKTTGGDYNEQQSGAVMSQSVIVDSIIEEWIKHAAHLSTVVFAVTVAHSQQLCARFRATGVQAEHIDGSTGLETRKSVLRRVELGITKVLCNVGIAVEGLDIPRLKCCVLARPTKSLTRAIQMVGRVMRPYEGLIARIHDHAFVLQQHGLPDDPRDYRLNAKETPPPLSEMRTCPQCLALFRGSVCPACRIELPVKEREIHTIKTAEQVTFESGMPAPRNDIPVPISWNQPGRVLEGVLLKRWSEKTEFGLRKFYALQGVKRDYHFPGTSELNRKLDQIPDSSRVRLTYVGEEWIAERSRKRFRVEVDDA